MAVSTALTLQNPRVDNSCKSLTSGDNMHLPGTDDYVLSRPADLTSNFMAHVHVLAAQGHRDQGSMISQFKVLRSPNLDNGCKPSTSGDSLSDGLLRSHVRYLVSYLMF